MGPWGFLVLAGVFEVGFASCLKLSEGFTRHWATAAFIALGAASFYCLTKAMAHIPVGTAYAIWTGIGALGTALVGVCFFNDPATLARMGFLTLLVVSLVGLKLVS
ncbi:DMT family transporter [Gallaecimonas pentaromativorans]|uniref:Guanidinium exporter n=1 Tax=Gallaecimonas pentaromativorans TaxID=584787 RepID=A0A3N1PBD3_9GAMM|nr:multidrug efflux SMR transporter [Gallaecimonas pentaromativorans]ROQ28712.1 quaternary ammonium compound-resistance protein SugE [Gallaecimonas pentaromativorans]